jgi:hypothetical protein
MLGLGLGDIIGQIGQGARAQGPVGPRVYVFICLVIRFKVQDSGFKVIYIYIYNYFYIKYI